MSLIDQHSSSLVRFGDQPRTYETLTGDHYERLRKLVSNRFAASQTHLRDRFERFYRYEKLIHMITKKKQFDWKANVFLPYAFSLSEQSAAIKWLALFMTRPFVTVEPRRGDPELHEIALRRQALLDWRMTGELDVVSLGMDMFRQSERYGKAVAIITPRMDKQSVPYRQITEMPTAYGPLARMSWKMREESKYRLHAEVMDLTDLRVEPGRRRINGPLGMRWIGREYYLTFDELRLMQSQGEIGPMVGGQEVSDLKDSNAPNTEDYKLRRMLLRSAGDAERYVDPYDKPVKLAEYQGWVPIDALDPQVAEMEFRDGLNPMKRLIILANDRVILEDLALPWDHGNWSYIDMDCVPDPHDFWGKGKVEPIEHVNYASNELVNMRLDNVKQAVNGMMGVNNQMMVSGWKERLISQPYGVIECDGEPQRAIQRIPLGDVTASSYEEQQQMFTLMQEADAVNETMLGAPGPERTLGEHVLKAESASKRIQLELVGSAYQLLGFATGLSRFIIGLDRQYLPIPTYLAVADPQSQDDMMTLGVGPMTMNADDTLFSYLPTGATEGINIQSKRQELAQMLQALEPFGPIMGPMGFNFGEMVKTILKMFGYDPARYFPKIVGTSDMPGMMNQGMPGQMPGGMGGPQQVQGPPGSQPGMPIPRGGPSPAAGQRLQVNPAVMAALAQISGRAA